MANEKKAEGRPMGWIKNLLNNVTLLKWVKKFSADNLLADNALAEKFGIRCNEESISVGDSTMTKLFVTQARFAGKEIVRYNVKQMREALDLTGPEGELIIAQDNNKELFIQAKDNVVVVSPLPKADDKKGD